MNSRARWATFLILTFCSQGFCQKIKYKDLFVLLNAKQFTEAEPFLKKYLKDNDDNPNAYLFMGMIYQEKATKQDVLKQTEALVRQIDSAVYFYDLANKGMTEKEVSRNEEYYQMYNRRDLRTGKFGVKLSDVQLDIETRMKLKERAALITKLKSQFLAAAKYYEKAQHIFLEMQKAYAGQKEFYLRADDRSQADLAHLAKVYDSCHISFNEYKSTAALVGKTGYNQDLDPDEIKDFKKDGGTPADFYRDDLKVWDYKRWGLSSLEFIQKEITPLKDQLVAMDVEVNSVHQKLKKDSVSVRQEITLLHGKLGFPALRKIDPQPLPLKVLEMKVAEIEYGSQIVEDRSLRDSANVGLQVAAIRKELALAKRIDSISGFLVERNLDEEAENYSHFVVTAFGNAAVLKSLIKTTKDYAVREVASREAALAKKNESLKWIINGADSIPLFVDVPPASKCRPLILQEEKFTAGLQFADSLATGYFYTITPSRKPDVKATYAVDRSAFRKRNLPFIKALTAQDEKGLVYFVIVYSEAKSGDKYPATIAKIYRAEGLAWTINSSFDHVPSEMVFSSESFELTVKIKTSLGEISGVVFDKNGKLLK